MLTKLRPCWQTGIKIAPASALLLPFLLAQQQNGYLIDTHTTHLFISFSNTSQLSRLLPTERQTDIPDSKPMHLPLVRTTQPWWLDSAIPFSSPDPSSTAHQAATSPQHYQKGPTVLFNWLWMSPLQNETPPQHRPPSVSQTSAHHTAVMDGLADMTST